ncbi:MAG: hypothetical protein MI861_07220, partial [Pirellulales bacterium]|nr:hypothetical protein [Pirellulales bacterium]
AADTVTSTANSITIGTAQTAGRTVTVGNTNFAELNVITLGGDDNVDLDLGLAGVRKVVDLGAGNDNLDASGMLDGDFFGGIGNDVIIGSPLADRIFGGAGDDVLIGGGGDDFQYGEDGNDTFGNPNLVADGVADDPGADHNFGGAGFDNFIWEPGDGADVNNGGGDAADIFRFFGNDAASTFELRSGGTPTHLNALFNGVLIDNHGIEDVLVDPLGGNDTINVDDLFQTEVVNVTIAADGGDETINVTGRTVADNLNVTTPAAGVVSIEGLSYDVNITGSAVADSLTINADDGDDVIDVAEGLSTVITTTLNGEEGDDTLSGEFNVANGGAGDDSILGAAIDQTINGGSGDDGIDGRGGTDTIDGGSGGDRVLVSGTDADDTINLSQNAGGDLVVSAAGVTTVYTDAGAAGIDGTNVEQIVVDGQLGDDTLTVDVAPGDVINVPITFDGGAGSDLLVVTGSPATAIEDVQYTPGPAITDGRLVYDADTNRNNGVAMTIDFTNLEPVLDLVV